MTHALEFSQDIKPLEQHFNSNKSVPFLYTKDKQAEKEIRETTPFILVTNNLKFLGVKLISK